MQKKKLSTESRAQANANGMVILGRAHLTKKERKLQCNSTHCIHFMLFSLLFFSCFGLLADCHYTIVVGVVRFNVCISNRIMHISKQLYLNPMRLVIIIIIKSYNGREKAAREEQFLKRAIIVFFHSA